ncbi:hypothetical protein QBC37DRAFT_449709 [Rhypophila decipiens]|uniref:Uncharacterized protein n=1 Tax=Rhypophila decipiens TaxID=261697 RepID=A0AAN6YJZ4_9PEZI|nr:hypothetical protein QBC37DRAFT_449709 [Rhypophila decipiens]
MSRSVISRLVLEKTQLSQPYAFTHIVASPGLETTKAILETLLEKIKETSEPGKTPTLIYAVETFDAVQAISNYMKDTGSDMASIIPIKNIAQVRVDEQGNLLLLKTMTSPLRATAASASEQPDSSALLSDEYKTLRNEVLALLQNSNSVPGGDLPSAMEFMKASVAAGCARLYDIEHEPEEVSVDYLHSFAWTFMANKAFGYDAPMIKKTYGFAHRALEAALDDPENVQQGPEYAEYFAKRRKVNPEPKEQPTTTKASTPATATTLLVESEKNFSLPAAGDGENEPKGSRLVKLVQLPTYVESFGKNYSPPAAGDGENEPKGSKMVELVQLPTYVESFGKNYSPPVAGDGEEWVTVGGNRFRMGSRPANARAKEDAVANEKADCDLVQSKISAVLNNKTKSVKDVREHLNRIWRETSPLFRSCPKAVKLWMYNLWRTARIDDPSHVDASYAWLFDLELVDPSGQIMYL